MLCFGENTCKGPEVCLRIERRLVCCLVGELSREWVALRWRESGVESLAYFGSHAAP